MIHHLFHPEISPQKTPLRLTLPRLSVLIVIATPWSQPQSAWRGQQGRPWVMKWTMHYSQVIRVCLPPVPTKMVPGENVTTEFCFRWLEPIKSMTHSADGERKHRGCQLFPLGPREKSRYLSSACFPCLLTSCWITFHLSGDLSELFFF